MANNPAEQLVKACNSIGGEATIEDRNRGEIVHSECELENGSEIEALGPNMQFKKNYPAVSLSDGDRDTESHMTPDRDKEISISHDKIMDGIDIKIKGENGIDSKHLVRD